MDISRTHAMLNETNKKFSVNINTGTINWL